MNKTVREKFGTHVITLTACPGENVAVVVRAKNGVKLLSMNLRDEVTIFVAGAKSVERVACEHHRNIGK